MGGSEVLIITAYPHRNDIHEEHNCDKWHMPHTDIKDGDGRESG